MIERPEINLSKRPYVAAKFSLRSQVPSLKNSPGLAMRDDKGNYLAKPRRFTDKTIRKVMDGMTSQAKGFWMGISPLTEVWVTFVFRVSHLRGDLSNTATTVMDVLRDAGVITDDNMNHIVSETSQWTLVLPGNEGVDVSLAGLENTKPVKAQHKKYIKKLRTDLKTNR